MLNYRTMMLAGAAASVMALAGAPAFAQESADSAVMHAQPAAAEVASGPAVDEVVVTAERRAQNLQDYAGVAQAFTQEDLKAVGILRIEDLETAVTGLSISNQEGNVQIYIRGIGTSNNTELGDPSAATHFNGVYLPRPRGVGGMFFDLQSVEVDKGPQGTLRGRNAVAGTLNIIPRAPRLGDSEGYAEAGVGLNNERDWEAALNVPVGQTFALRGAIWGMDTDGAYHNVGNDQSLKPAGIDHQWSARLSALWQPTDRARISIIGDYEHEDGTGYPSTNVKGALVGGHTPDEFELRDVLYHGTQGYERDNNWGVQANLSYDFGPAVLEASSSFRAVDFYQANAANDGIVYPGHGPNSIDYDSFSGSVYWLTKSWSRVDELRLTSPADSKVIWSLGAFHFNENQDVGFMSVADNGLFYSGTEFTMPTVHGRSWAEYADITFPITEQLRVKGGFRHTSEDKFRFGVGGNWVLGLGSDGFGCCFVTRFGTQGFQPNFLDRPEEFFHIPANVSNAYAAAYMAAAMTPGARDTLLQQIAGVADGSRPNGTCVDTPDTDPNGTQNCPANGQHSFFVLGIPSQQEGTYDDDFNDWRAGVEYDLSPDSLLYATVSTGHKSGGFNDTINVAGSLQSPIFKPESVILYEVGAKNTFDMNGSRVRLNGDLFWYDYKDQVFQTLVAIGGGVGAAGYSQQNINVANSTIKGFEVEADFQLPMGFDLNLNAAYIDAKADKGALFDTRANDFGAGTPNFIVDISGNRLPLVSKYNLTANLQQTFPLFGGQADWHALVSWRSAYYLSIYNELPVIQGQVATAGSVIDPRSPPAGLTVTDARAAGFWGKQPAYATLSLGVGWQPENGHWRIEGYLSNVFDKTAVDKALVSDINTNIFFLNQARAGGVRLRVSF